jgi:predicted DNA-binding transcriptional regulator AlpA
MMATASLNISVTEKRMMNEAEASSYCGLPAKYFKTTCPVIPINLGGKALRYDKRDLDQWIDAEKTGGTEQTRDSILGKL